VDAHSQVAVDLFLAVEQHDYERIRALCAPEFAISQNGGQKRGVEAVIWWSEMLARSAPDAGYWNHERSGTADGFVEEHDFCATLPSGDRLNLRVCVVASVQAGRITELREYLDTGSIAPLLEVFRAAAAAS
jgi:ketosteroid isomerase-like protein